MRSHIITAPASLDVVEIVEYLSDRMIESGEQCLKGSLRMLKNNLLMRKELTNERG